MSLSESYDLNSDFGSDSFGFSFSQDTPPDGCTQCGQCMPSCPTYKQSGELVHSPMGRIQIMRNINNDDYAYQRQDYLALENCLACGTCETVCPSKVDYTGMLYESKATLETHQKNPLSTKVLLGLLKYPRLLDTLTKLAKPLIPLADNMKDKVASQELKSLFNGLYFLKFTGQRDTRSYSKLPISKTPYKVSLFTACVSNVFDRQVLEATKSLLYSCGVEVKVPEKQRCCGSAHVHNGDREAAKALATKNLQMLANSSTDTIITTASACGKFLKEYDTFVKAEDSSDASTRSRPMEEIVTDISTWLVNSKVLNDFAFNACDKVVVLHTPCTMKTDEQAAFAVKNLLSRIPGLRIHELTETISCCGAGGSHLVMQPENSRDIGLESIDEIKKINPDIVLTSNTVCSLQLKRGLHEQNLNCEVLHPVQLLERQLQEQRRAYEPVY